MKRPLLFSTVVSGLVSFLVAMYFTAVGLWWAGMVAALFIGPMLGWYTRTISVRVAAFRAGWAAARNKPVDGS